MKKIIFFTIKKIKVYIKGVIGVLLLLFSIHLNGQETEQEGGLDLLDESLFVGGLSPVVLDHEEMEVNVYSSLFSSWVALHASAVQESQVVDRLRFSEFTTNAEVYYGFSRSNKWDLGLRLRYGNRRFDNAARSSVFDVFKTEETDNVGTDKTYTGMREIGVRVRFLPFSNIEELSVNTGFSFGKFSNAKDDDVYKLSDRNIFDLNVTYYIPLNIDRSSFYYFIFNGSAAFPGSLPENKEALYNTTGSFFVVQRIGKVVVYPGLSYNITFKEPSEGSFSDASLIRSGTQLLGTLGLQFQPSNSFSFNLGLSIPFLLTSTNKRQRLVRDSYSLANIGFRLLL